MWWSWIESIWSRCGSIRNDLGQQKRILHLSLSVVYLSAFSSYHSPVHIITLPSLFLTFTSSVPPLFQTYTCHVPVCPSATIYFFFSHSFSLYFLSFSLTVISPKQVESLKWFSLIVPLSHHFLPFSIYISSLVVGVIVINQQQYKLKIMTNTLPIVSTKPIIVTRRTTTKRTKPVNEAASITRSLVLQEVEVKSLSNCILAS